MFSFTFFGTSVPHFFFEALAAERARSVEELQKQLAAMQVQLPGRLLVLFDVVC